MRRYMSHSENSRIAQRVIEKLLRQTVDTNVMQLLSCQGLELQISVSSPFVDLEKAFDRVPSDVI